MSHVDAPQRCGICLIINRPDDAILYGLRAKERPEGLDAHRKRPIKYSALLYLSSTVPVV